MHHGSHIRPDGSECVCGNPRACAPMAEHSFLRDYDPAAYRDIPEVDKLNVRLTYLKAFSPYDGKKEILEIERRLADITPKP